MWVWADSRNGYFSLLEVYTGKKKGAVEHRVVKDLTKELHGKWHHVYLDNFFTSFSLLSDQEKSGIYGYGTARKDGCGTARKDRRGFPEKLETATFKTGKIHTLHKEKLDKQFVVYTMHVISHHKYGVYTHYNYKLLTFLEASH